jgi:hypothetical protein
MLPINWTALTNSLLDAVSGDPKNAHLKKLDRAPENLHLFKADVLDCETLTPAVQGCQGVFHLATPVPEDKILHPDVSLFISIGRERNFSFKLLFLQN